MARYSVLQTYYILVGTEVRCLHDGILFLFYSSLDMSELAKQAKKKLQAVSSFLFLLTLI